jgi:hypothetical protein
MTMGVSAKDREIIRDLAARVAEIAADPHQDEMRELWNKVNHLERTRPLILLHDATQHETGDKVECVCEDGAVRGLEFDLRQRIYHWETRRDDAIWEDTIYTRIPVHHESYGIKSNWTKPDHVFGASHFNPILNGDEDPTEMIAMPVIEPDWDAANNHHAFVSDLIGDILNVRKRGEQFFWYAPIDTFIEWRGIENMMMDTIERPEWLHAWLNRMYEWNLSIIEQFEAAGVLGFNHTGEAAIGSGGVGYTTELPADGADPDRPRLKDMWGHATTQIFSEVSPAMHDEFALTYEAKFLSRFGLSNYGCCEPLHHKVDLVLERIPNCRKLSMSPWVDITAGAEALSKRAVFSWKPNPAWLGMPTWDIEWQREQVKDAFEKTRDNVVEVVMKDLHTVCGEVSRMGDWVAMAREVAMDYA